MGSVIATAPMAHVRRKAIAGRPGLGIIIINERETVISMNVRPLHDRIIVQRLEDANDRVGSIVIPDSAKEKPQQGKVLVAGLGKTNKDGTRLPLDVKAGDTILFGKYSGQEVKLDGIEYLIMKEDDVLAIQDRSA
jgi:chaperonin GroES